MENLKEFEEKDMEQIALTPEKIKTILKNSIKSKLAFLEKTDDEIIYGL
jgi:hypothetical protein